MSPCLRMIYTPLYATLCVDHLVEVYAEVHVGNYWDRCGIRQGYLEYVCRWWCNSTCHIANQRTHGS